MLLNFPVYDASLRYVPLKHAEARTNSENKLGFKRTSIHEHDQESNRYWQIFIFIFGHMAIYRIRKIAIRCLLARLIKRCRCLAANAQFRDTLSECIIISVTWSWFVCCARDISRDINSSFKTNVKNIQVFLFYYLFYYLFEIFIILSEKYY